MKPSARIITASISVVAIVCVQSVTAQDIDYCDQLGNPTIEITAPSPAAAFAPLDEIAIAVEPLGDEPLNSVIIAVHDVDFLKFLSDPPFTATLFVPEVHVGELEILAMGRTGDEPETCAEPVTVLVETHEELAELAVESSNPMVLVGPDHHRQILVRGMYAIDWPGDGFYRNVTHPSTGTTYRSADSSVAEVTEEGVILPQGNGETVIIVENGDLRAEQHVHVMGF